MKRPTKYSRPLAGVRKEDYHPRDIQGQYVKDLNTYIDYLEKKLLIQESEKFLKLPDDYIVDAALAMGRTLNKNKD
jgi:hypothetical protein